MKILKNHLISTNEIESSVNPAALVTGIVNALRTEAAKWGVSEQSIDLSITANEDFVIFRMSAPIYFDGLYCA